MPLELGGTKKPRCGPNDSKQFEHAVDALLSTSLVPFGHAWLAHEPNNPGADRSVPAGQVLMHSVEELLSRSRVPF